VPGTVTCIIDVNVFHFFTAHEELAQLTEAERHALQNSNDFFEFGSDDGEALEPEPKVKQCFCLFNNTGYNISES
jgi:hypothetical protein